MPYISFVRDAMSGIDKLETKCTRWNDSRLGLLQYVFSFAPYSLEETPDHRKIKGNMGSKIQLEHFVD